MAERKAAGLMARGTAGGQIDAMLAAGHEKAPPVKPAGPHVGNAIKGLVIRGGMTKPKHYTQVLEFVINRC
jgi:hypothetical protein